MNKKLKDKRIKVYGAEKSNNEQIEPVLISIPLEELKLVKEWITKASFPLVVYSDNIEDMKEERDRCIKDNLEFLMRWINEY